LSDDRRSYVAKFLAEQDLSRPLVERFALVARGVTDSDLIGVTIGFPSQGIRGGTSFGSDVDGVHADEVQFDLGEGPSVDALTSFVPVVIGDLLSADSLRRWPFAAPALASIGLKGVFSFPLRVGGAQIGVLSAYRRLQGDISPSHYANGLVVATLLTTAVLEHEATKGAGESLDGESFALTDGRVHFAAGMVAERLDIPVVEALIRLRGHAFISGLSIRDVSEQVISHALEIEK
jgi:hypothetical protein